jgi:carbonic anhydrase/acetyltransferase-like protein (isoleucine patch superfamily)
MYIGVNVWLGAGVIVLGALSIGHGSVVGAGSVVTKDIPPFSIAAGNPCKVIKRYDFRANEWVRTEDFDNENEALMPDEETYLTALKASAPAITMPLYAATSSKGDLP